MSLSSTVTEIFSVECWHNFEIWVKGSLRSLKMAPIDRSYTTLYWSAVVTIALSCTIFELFEIYVTGHSRSLEVAHSIDRIRVPIRLSLWMCIYLPTVTETYSVKYWFKLEIWVNRVVQGYWKWCRSIDHTTLYWSAVVTIALCCTIFKLFVVQSAVTLKSRLGTIEIHWKWHHSIDRIRVPIRLPLYGSILCCFRNKARYWSRTRTRYSYPLVLNLPDPLEALQMFAQNCNTSCQSLSY